MEQSPVIINSLSDNLFTTMQSPSNWLQLGIILGTGLIAWFLHRFWGRYQANIDKERTGRIKQLTLKTGLRLVFPFTMLMLVLIARVIAQQANYPVKLLDIAVPLLLTLGIIRLTVYVLRKAFAPSPTLRTWENTIAITIWIAATMHLLGWLPELLLAMDKLAIQVGATRITLLSTLKLIISVAFFLILTLFLSTTIEKRLLKSSMLNPGLRLGLAKTSRVLLVTIGFLIALNIIGIDLTALTVFGGALGVGLGFGLQRIASNFISGFILLFDRSIRPGDVISIGTSFGWVRELRGRYVVVRDRDGVETLIPNENLITSEVINWSYSDLNVRIKVPVQVSYNDDPEKTMALMIDCAKASSRVLDDPAPACRLMGFGDNGINLELRVWVNDPQEGLSNVRSDIFIAIWRAFKENRITIPFPQRDLRLLEMPGSAGNDAA